MCAVFQSLGKLPVESDLEYILVRGMHIISAHSFITLGGQPSGPGDLHVWISLSFSRTLSGVITMSERAGTAISKLKAGREEMFSLVNTLVKKLLNILTLEASQCTILPSELIKPFIVGCVLSRDLKYFQNAFGLVFRFLVIDSSKVFLSFLVRDLNVFLVDVKAA